MISMKIFIQKDYVGDKKVLPANLESHFQKNRQFLPPTPAMMTQDNPSHIVIVADDR
jgi:hypothetical protein